MNEAETRPSSVVLGCHVRAMARRGTARDLYCQIPRSHACGGVDPSFSLDVTSAACSTTDEELPVHWHEIQITTRTVWRQMQQESTPSLSLAVTSASCATSTAWNPHDPSAHATHRRPWLTCWHPGSARNPTTSVLLSLYGVRRSRGDPLSSLVDTSAPRNRTRSTLPPCSATRDPDHYDTILTVADSGHRHPWISHRRRG
jgi:hypothetical protein